jgi:arsenate reductase
VGDARELVKPINKKEVEGMGEAEILTYLAANPNSVRRPIIDTGGFITLGFTPAVRAKLEGK